MTEPLRVGIAGFGVIGQRRKKHLDEHHDVLVMGVSDIMRGDEPSLHDGTPVFRTHAELLQLPLDALFVCVPNEFAPSLTIEGLSAGLHVFCEKPPGRTVEDIEEVRAVEAAHPHLKLKYGFNHRYHSSVIEALDYVESAKLGRLLNIRGVYGKSAVVPWPRPQATGNWEDDVKVWRTSRAIAGGGILLDQGIHMVDLMLAFAGPFEEIKSFVSNSYWKHDVEDNAYALMRTSSGTIAMLHSTATQWRHRFRLEIHLEEGALLLKGILSGSRSYGNETLTVVYREDDVKGNPRETSTTYIRDHSWALEIAEFVDCIRRDEPIRIGRSEEALLAMKTVFDIYGADEAWRDRFPTG
jgi:predicted dehydrogenase